MVGCFFWQAVVMASEWCTCPCCGHGTLAAGPGVYELCPVCHWEDDGTQGERPWSSDGANGISLYEAQQNYSRFGAAHQDSVPLVRRPRSDEPLDPTWRPYEPTDDERAKMERERVRRQREEDVMTGRTGDGSGQGVAG
jgi:hypothetical protein